jgi:carbon monoxide dehydrogenase subunit G
MAMTMTGEIQLAASRNAVWEKLNDPDVLKACIPGCEAKDDLHLAVAQRFLAHG